MIKRTLFFRTPAYLSNRNEQLVDSYPEKEKPDANIPIENLCLVVLKRGRFGEYKNQKVFKRISTDYSKC